MRAFVTGGSGFVGRYLIAALVAQGHAVRALSRSQASIDAVKAAGAEPARGDLSDAAALQQAMAGCDAVFHAAAHVKQWGEPDEFFAVNVRGTENVIAAARAAGVKRLVHISTEAVLAGGPLVGVDESQPRPKRPAGLYPLTKGMAEERVLAANGPGFTSLAVRPRFIWGKGDTSVLPQIAAAVRAGKFAWFERGHYPTSTCHVKNVVEGALRACERGRGGEAYFLTDGDPVELREFLTAMLRTLGVEPTSRSIPRWLGDATAAVSETAWRLFRLSGEPPVTRTTMHLFGRPVTVSDAKARRELGYVGAVSREQGLREMAEGRPQ
jgi:nucleoside-diphosphate-sugar epimerase